MKRLATAGACCCLLLAACTPQDPAPSPSSTEQATRSATPSPSPSESPESTMTTAPEPPQTMPPGLSEEQQAALQTVQTYHTLLDQAQKDPEFDMTPLTILFARPEAQRYGYFWVAKDRKNGILKVGNFGYRYEVDEVVEAAGVRSVAVTTCIDSTKSDLIDSNGESILDPERDKYVTFYFDVIHNGKVWQINDFQTENGKC